MKKLCIMLFSIALGLNSIRASHELILTDEKGKGVKIEISDSITQLFDLSSLLQIPFTHFKKYMLRFKSESHDLYDVLIEHVIVPFCKNKIQEFIYGCVPPDAHITFVEQKARFLDFYLQDLDLNSYKKACYHLLHSLTEMQDLFRPAIISLLKKKNPEEEEAHFLDNYCFYDGSYGLEKIHCLRSSSRREYMINIFYIAFSLRLFSLMDYFLSIGIKPDHVYYKDWLLHNRYYRSYGTYHVYHSTRTKKPHGITLLDILKQEIKPDDGEMQNYFTSRLEVRFDIWGRAL